MNKRNAGIGVLLTLFLSVIVFLGANPKDKTLAHISSWGISSPIKFIQTHWGWLIVVIFLSLWANHRLILRNEKRKERGQLAEALDDNAKKINSLLADYHEKFEAAQWHPHLKGADVSNRVKQSQKTYELEAELTEKFKRGFEHTSLSLLKEASIILKRDDYDKKTKYLTSRYMIDKYSKHLLEISEELKARR